MHTRGEQGIGRATATIGHGPRLVRLRAALLCPLICILAGCVAPWAPTPAPTPASVPALRLPGLVELPRATTPERSANAPASRFLAVVASQSPPPGGAIGEPRVVFDRDGALYDVGADRGDVRLLARTLPCAVSTRSSSLTRDGRWLACQSSGTPRLAMVPLDAGPDAAPIPLEHPTRAGAVSWSPDGTHLAAITGTAGPCSVSLYDVPPARTALVLTRVLAFPAFVVRYPDVDGCSLAEAAWSPDGQSLVIGAGEGPDTTYYLLSLVDLPAPDSSVDGVPVFVFPPGVLRRIARSDGYPAIWTPDASALVFVEGYRRIVRVSVATSEARTLLEIPVKPAWVCQVAPLPNGRRIAFTYCLLDGGPEIGMPDEGPFERLYVYTPPD